jgi:hypothetical protein
MPGVVAAIQTFGNHLNFHPHLHMLVTEGGRASDGAFHGVHIFNDSALARIFAHEVLVAGCAPNLCPGHKTFTQSNLGTVRVGMSSDDLRALLGEPDEEYDATFGGSVGEEWTGHVWLYFNGRDERLKYVARCKKSMFVFSSVGDQLRLNHWSVED